MVVLVLLACSPAPDGAGSSRDPSAAAIWARALRTGMCDAVVDERLHDACVVAAVERTREDRCSEPRSQRAREECAFRLAEKRLDASICRRAGAFAEDCALHVLSTGFMVWAPAGALPGGPEEDEVTRRIAAAGLRDDDMRPWSAWYRWVLGAQQPLDRSTCARVEPAVRGEACARTGLTVFEDRINRTRDTREPDGTSALACGAEPPLLAHAPDPELDAILLRRRGPCP
jgi:hypothetical protein